MEDIFPQPNSIVCVDNTIVFKAVYNPDSMVTGLFTELVMERSCELYSTEKNMQRCQEAVERKMLELIERLVMSRDPNIEQRRKYSIVIDALDVAIGRARRGRKPKNPSQNREFSVFAEEILEQVRGFVMQRFEFIKSFFTIKDYSSYKGEYMQAVSILGNKEPDNEDAHILALALMLHAKRNTPVLLWTDDTDFYDVEQVLKGYGVFPFKRIKGG